MYSFLSWFFQGCQYDYLEVKSTINSTRLCGDKIPDVMMSTSNEMDLEFCSDNSMSLKGFALKYYTGIVDLYNALTNIRLVR